MEPIIVDVRSPVEYSHDHVKGSINIPPEEFMKGAPQLEGVAKDIPIILYCISGSRSNVAANILKQLKFSNVTNGINKDHVEAMLKKPQ